MCENTNTITNTNASTNTNTNLGDKELLLDVCCTSASTDINDNRQLTQFQIFLEIFVGEYHKKHDFNATAVDCTTPTDGH